MRRTLLALCCLALIAASVNVKKEEIEAAKRLYGEQKERVEKKYGSKKDKGDKQMLLYQEKLAEVSSEYLAAVTGRIFTIRKPEDNDQENELAALKELEKELIAQLKEAHEKGALVIRKVAGMEFVPIAKDGVLRHGQFTTVAEPDIEKVHEFLRIKNKYTYSASLLGQKVRDYGVGEEETAFEQFYDIKRDLLLWFYLISPKKQSAVLSIKLEDKGDVLKGVWVNFEEQKVKDTKARVKATLREGLNVILVQADNEESQNLKIESVIRGKSLQIGK